MTEVNMLAVLIAGIVAMVIGALWYSPVLFSKIWMKEMNFGAEMMAGTEKPNMTKLYVGQFILTLVTAYVLAHFISLLDITTLGGALSLAFWSWFGFQVLPLMASVFWEGKSFKLFVINGLHYLVSLIIMASIIVLVG